MGRISQLIIIHALICVLLTLTAIPAMANLGTTVPIIEENVFPGERLTKEIGVYNTDRNQSINITAKVYGEVQESDGTGNPVDPSKDTYKYSARPFFNVTPAAFHLGPGAKENITFEGVIPQNVGAGGRYAIIRLESAPLGKGTVGVALAIEIPVKLSIKGSDYIMTGNITDLKMAEPISAKEPKAMINFVNTGNYHYKANAEAAIMDSSGSILANTTMPLGFSNIIPLSMRSVELKMTPSQELKKGSYTLEATVVRDDGAILDSKKLEFSV